MQCPFCAADSQVTDSRASNDGQIRRRRSCTECKRKFTTYERVGSPTLKVVKRSGKSETFSSEKLAACLGRVGRRRLSAEQISRLGRDIEARLVDSNLKKVSSGQIAELVLERLAEIDPVSRARLAANYIDEDGQLRTRSRDDDDDGVEQLGLFGADSD